MDFLNPGKHALLVAQLTEGVCLNIAVTDAFPRSAITLPRVWVTLVLLVTPVLFLLMFLTESSFRQLWTAGVMARVFCFPWHFHTSIWA